MAKDTSKTQGTATGNPFLNANAPHMQAPADVDRVSLLKQEEAAAPKVSASVAEAIAANPKNATTRELLHPDFHKKLGVQVYAVNFSEHLARVRDADAIDWLNENMPEVKLTKDTIKGGRLFTYDPVLLAQLIERMPKKTRVTGGSSVKFVVESSDVLGTDGQTYVVCDSVETAIDAVAGTATRQYVGVKMHGTYSAETRTGSFVMIRDGKTMKVVMTVKRAVDAYPENYVDGKTPKAGVKVSPDRLVFVMTANITNADGKRQPIVVRSYGQTNTINSFMKQYDRIVFE